MPELRKTIIRNTCPKGNNNFVEKKKLAPGPRTSLVPAAALIPALIAYLKVAADKNLSVGLFVVRSSGGASEFIVSRGHLIKFLCLSFEKKAHGQ